MKRILFVILMLATSLLFGCMTEQGVTNSSLPTETVNEPSFDKTMELAWISWKGSPFTGKDWYGKGLDFLIDSTDTINDSSLLSIMDSMDLVIPLDSNEKIVSYTRNLYVALSDTKRLDQSMKPYYAAHYTNGIWMIAFTDKVFTPRSEWEDSVPDASYAGLWYTYVLVNDSNGQILTILKSTSNKYSDSYVDADAANIACEGQLYDVEWHSAWYEEYIDSLYAPFIGTGGDTYTFDDSDMQAIATNVLSGRSLDSVEDVAMYANAILPALEDHGYFDAIKFGSVQRDVLPYFATHHTNGTWTITYCTDWTSDYSCNVIVNAEDGQVLNIA